MISVRECENPQNVWEEEEQNQMSEQLQKALQVADLIEVLRCKPMCDDYMGKEEVHTALISLATRTKNGFGRHSNLREEEILVLRGPRYYY